MSSFNSTSSRARYKPKRLETARMDLDSFYADVNTTVALATHHSVSLFKANNLANACQTQKLLMISRAAITAPSRFTSAQ
jgi:hypothetical protein